DWIFQFYPNQSVEYNHKNQIDKLEFLRVLLNTIIQQAQVSPPTISVQPQIISVQSNQHQSQQIPPNAITNPNMNLKEQPLILPISSTFQVNINFGIHNVVEIKDYANYLIGKQNKGESFTEQDIYWIFQFCRDKTDEYNQSNQNDKFRLIYAILKEIIKKAETSSPNANQLKPQSKDTIPQQISISKSIQQSSSSSQLNKPFITSWKKSDFKKIKEIGSGRFGTVYSMQEIRTQHIVAIKKCKYENQQQKDMVDKEVAAMREIYQIISQSAQQSSFLHTVQPLGFFLNDEGNKAFIVMEYCERGDLRKYINDLRNLEAEISQKKCYEIVGQLASSIQQLHMNGIIHGDMKPDNVLLTEDLKVKLADFGLTRKLREGKEYMTFLGGTTVYQAPEVLQTQNVQQIPTGGEEQTTQRRTQTIAVDIWAIGIMLFELLAQHHPFIGKDEDAANLSEMDIGIRIVNLQPTELPAHYPVSLRNLIMAMLSKDPSRRITAEEILEIPEVAASLRKQLQNGEYEN
ncbi:MAG: putative Serine/threonine protein kinase, partial [Streblomastix strix]